MFLNTNTNSIQSYRQLKIYIFFFHFFSYLFFQVVIKWPDNRRENRGINLVCYGDPKGYSAMAKTVGFPCAIATRYNSSLKNDYINHKVILCKVK